MSTNQTSISKNSSILKTAMSAALPVAISILITGLFTFSAGTLFGYNLEIHTPPILEPSAEEKPVFTGRLLRAIEESSLDNHDYASELILHMMQQVKISNFDMEFGNNEIENKAEIVKLISRLKWEIADCIASQQLHEGYLSECTTLFNFKTDKVSEKREIKDSNFIKNYFDDFNAKNMAFHAAARYPVGASDLPRIFQLLGVERLLADDLLKKCENQYPASSNVAYEFDLCSALSKQTSKIFNLLEKTELQIKSLGNGNNRIQNYVFKNMLIVAVFATLIASIIQQALSRSRKQLTKTDDSIHNIQETDSNNTT